MIGYIDNEIWGDERCSSPIVFSVCGLENVMLKVSLFTSKV